MYRDGILVNEDPTASTVTYSPAGHDTLELGRPNNGFSMFAKYGEAYIDELYICECILSEMDVVYLYLSYFHQ